MPRENIKNLNVPLPISLVNEVKKYSDKSGIKIWKVVECALLQHMDRVKRIKGDK